MANTLTNEAGETFEVGDQVIVCHPFLLEENVKGKISEIDYCNETKPIVVEFEEPITTNSGSVAFKGRYSMGSVRKLIEPTRETIFNFDSPVGKVIQASVFDQFLPEIEKTTNHAVLVIHYKLEALGLDPETDEYKAISMRIEAGLRNRFAGHLTFADQ